MSEALLSSELAAALAAIDAKIAAPDNSASRIAPHHALIAKLVAARPDAPGPAITAGLSAELGRSFTSTEMRAIAAYARACKASSKKGSAKKATVAKAMPSTAPTVVAPPVLALAPVSPTVTDAALAERAGGGYRGMVFKGHDRPVREFFGSIDKKASVETILQRASIIARDADAIADVATLDPYDAATVRIFIDAAASRGMSC